ncbi:TPA: DNA polymerase III subunit delta [Patescibacteria group bacterium]|nr:DNA polymerase III subunit delta [Patescibacteria group bacterium]
MILFLHGEDSFSSRQKLLAIKQKFIARPPADNIETIAGDKITPDRLRQAILGQTLLGGARLVVFEDLLLYAADAVRAVLAHLVETGWSDETTVIIYETHKCDRRLVLFKTLNQPKQAEEFTPLVGPALRRCAKQMAATYQVMVSDALLEMILASTGSDLWWLDNELRKLSAYAYGRPVTQDDIRLLLGGSGATNLFQLVVAALARDLTQAQHILIRSLTTGEDEIKLMGAIAYQLRHLVRIHELRTSGVPMEEAARVLGLPPFVVRANWQSAARFDLKQLSQAYDHLLQCDWNIKTGVWDPEDALELFTLKLAVT